MCASRTARKGRERANRRRLIALVAAVGIVGVLTAVVLIVNGRAESDADTASVKQSAEATGTLLAGAGQPATQAKAVSQIVEVPDVRGKSITEAEMVMSMAGFVVERRLDEDAEPDPDRRVSAQDPAPGSKLEAGATIVLSHAGEPEADDTKPSTQYVVAIDPGHQRRSNMTPEPIGPGSSETKPKVTGGAQGVASRMPEYEFALDLSNEVRQRLEDRGVKVVMTRTKHDVDLSNVERARAANKAGADLVVRVHADSNVDRTLSGIGTLHPSANRWTRPIAKRSAKAAARVQTALVAATGAKDRGTRERGDITGFNWSKVPVILVEAGFLSNPAEDELLASPAYRDKLADGIADGVMAYLEG